MTLTTSVADLRRQGVHIYPYLDLALEEPRSALKFAMGTAQCFGLTINRNKSTVFSLSDCNTYGLFWSQFWRTYFCHQKNMTIFVTPMQVFFLGQRSQLAFDSVLINVKATMSPYEKIVSRLDHKMYELSNLVKSVQWLTEIRIDEMGVTSERLHIT